nr:immunoglobulin heavy chain junction region [Macaca mulatta]
CARYVVVSATAPTFGIRFDLW